MCSHALEMCFGALANEGDNVLLPKPGADINDNVQSGANAGSPLAGFSLYKTICDSKVHFAAVMILPRHANP